MDWRNRVSTETTLSGLSRVATAICRTLALKHTVYASASIRNPPDNEPLLLTSFPDKWVNHYLKNNYQEIDPALLLAVTCSLPVNWDDISRRSSRVRKFFAEAKAMGVGRTGITLAINGPNGEPGVFSATSDMDRSEWATQSKCLEKEVTYLAHLIHDRALVIAGTTREQPEMPLSLMETSCLQWIADGLTMHAVAEKLKVSERSVRMHLSSARRKLNAENSVHAVAKMMRLGHIS